MMEVTLQFDVSKNRREIEDEYETEHWDRSDFPCFKRGFWTEQAGRTYNIHALLYKFPRILLIPGLQA